MRWQNREGESFAVDVSRRELNGTYRLLFDADFLDRLDSLYFFPNDVATDAAVTISARLGSALDGRVSLRAGALSGSRVGVVQSDDANWGVAQAALRVRATDTSVGIGYRQVAQSLVRGSAALHNDLQAVDVTLAQGLPLPRPPRTRLRLESTLLGRVRQAPRGRGRGEVRTAASRAASRSPSDAAAFQSAIVGSKIPFAGATVPGDDPVK